MTDIWLFVVKQQISSNDPRGNYSRSWWICWPSIHTFKSTNQQASLWMKVHWTISRFICLSVLFHPIFLFSLSLYVSFSCDAADLPYSRLSDCSLPQQTLRDSEWFYAIRIFRAYRPWCMRLSFDPLMIHLIRKNRSSECIRKLVIKKAIKAFLTFHFI